MIGRALQHCGLLFDVVLPVRCAACGMHGDEFCIACKRELMRAPLLLRPACGDMPAVAALGPHAGPLRSAVLNVKFRNRLHAAVMLGEMLGKKLDCADELLVFVPLHARRLRERGFNQAEAIARGIARSSGARVVADALVRTRATHPQRSLPLSGRGPNVLGAFALSGGAAMLPGSRVVLVDDVVTTGATIAACVCALREAGVACPRACAIALKI